MKNTPADRKRYFQELNEASETAFARKGLIEKTFRIHGRNFVLRCAGETMAKTVTRALNHLATEVRENDSFVLDCWDCAGSGLELPLPDWPREFFTGRGELRGLDSPEMRIAYFNWIQLLNVYFPETHRAFYCIADADRFPVQQLGSPALTIFSWWCAQLGWQFVHAAAVGTEQGGVLIVGRGGAGKSTLAFSTIDSPLRYLSDDYCILAPGEPPRAFALYSSGKLTEASLCLLPHLRSHAANADDRTREKAVFFWHEQFPGRQILEAPLRAVILSHISSFDTSLTAISKREIMGILAESTLRQLAGSGNEDFLRMARLTHSLPAYRLDHGLDSAATHKLLLQQCES
jgi:hypothetical protein